MWYASTENFICFQYLFISYMLFSSSHLTVPNFGRFFVRILILAVVGWSINTASFYYNYTRPTEALFPNFRNVTFARKYEGSLREYSSGWCWYIKPSLSAQIHSLGKVDLSRFNVSTDVNKLLKLAVPPHSVNNVIFKEDDHVVSQMNRTNTIAFISEYIWYNFTTI